MRIDTSVIDDVISAVNTYERGHLGMKNGPDYPALAVALLDSVKFNDLCKGATTMALLITLMSPSRAELEANKESALESLFKNSPMRAMLADVFYMGYCVGKREAEVSILEHNLTQKGEADGGN